MIAYEELAAALERWRTRNGLPATPPLFAGAPPPARATQAVAAVPPPPVAAVPLPVALATPVRSPPPPPSGRATMIGMAAPVIAAAPPPAPAPMELAADDSLDEPEVIEEAGDQYDNAGNDYAVGFDGQGAPEAGSSADGWPEAHTVATHGWGQPAPRAAEVDDADEATHIGEPTRHD